MGTDVSKSVSIAAKSRRSVRLNQANYKACNPSYESENKMGASASAATRTNTRVAVFLLSVHSVCTDAGERHRSCRSTHILHFSVLKQTAWGAVCVSSVGWRSVTQTQYVWRQMSPQHPPPPNTQTQPHVSLRPLYDWRRGFWNPEKPRRCCRSTLKHLN